AAAGVAERTARIKQNIARGMDAPPFGTDRRRWPGQETFKVIPLPAQGKLVTAPPDPPGTEKTFVAKMALRYGR
ncbi:MAG: hypothetical protein WD278_08575, partial [Pirellulales bacterium]